MGNEIKKLKKYVLYISTVFFILPLIHLGYLYLYSDAKLIPIEGGTISEGMVGEFPSLNPLEIQKGNNKYLIELLYRSLLEYNIEEDKIVSDIAKCDISNLKYIECYLENNIKWSDGSPITTDDIIATYTILKNSNINPIIHSLLLETEITGEPNIITFKNTKADISFLNVLFQPIVKQSVINELGEDHLTGHFSTIDGIYSGKYQISNVSRDISVGVTKLIFEKNEQYHNNPVITDRLIIKLFSNTNNLLKNKESINIFDDKNNILGNSIPRFKNEGYSLPQYVSIFINKDTVSNKSLRSFILNHIKRENLINLLGNEQFIPVENPYFTEKKISLTNNNKNLENIMSELGYFRKSKFLSDIMKKTEIVSDEVSVSSTGSTNETQPLLPNKQFSDYQEDSEYIIQPDFVDKYNFITRSNIILKGVTPENTQAVFINDQKIETFSSGQRYFYYKLGENIIQGENIYKIAFTVNNETKVYEELYFLYQNDKKKLEVEKTIFTEKVVTSEKQKEELQKSLENIEKAKEKQALASTTLQELELLNDRAFYNDKKEPFKLTLIYIIGEEHFEKTGTYIQNSLEKIGIEVELRPIQLNQLKQFISGDQDDNGKSYYDIMLTGIHLGYFAFNQFPYYHSSQAKGGYNFSNIRKTSLDILLEELKNNSLSKDKVSNIQDKILNILEKEQVVKTLYTPYFNLLIDKNIKNTELKDRLPNKFLRSELFSKAYILDKKIMNSSSKSLIGFLQYLIKKLHE